MQEARRKKEEEAAREAAQQTEHPVLEPAKGWTLEDDEEDDEEDKQDGRVGDTLAPEAKGSEGVGSQHIGAHIKQDVPPDSVAPLIQMILASRQETHWMRSWKGMLPRLPAICHLSA